jgi:predicted DNA-binding transcriptional regulator AlpA
MSDPRAATGNPQDFGGIDSGSAPTKASRKPALLDAAALQQRLFWTVPETAFLLRVGVRTVWRLMADPNSRFPTPRRVRGRTLLSRDEVLAFMAEDGAR